MKKKFGAPLEVLYLYIYIYIYVCDVSCLEKLKSGGLHVCCAQEVVYTKHVWLSLWGATSPKPLRLWSNCGAFLDALAQPVGIRG
jgi:hypothetical protein